MRKVIRKLIEQSIFFEYKLPNESKGIESSKYSNTQDFCFSNDRYEKISKLIYNSIIDYANNEYDIDEKGFRIINNCKEDGGQTVMHVNFHMLAGEKLSTNII